MCRLSVFVHRSAGCLNAILQDRHLKPLSFRTLIIFAELHTGQTLINLISKPLKFEGGSSKGR